MAQFPFLENIRNFDAFNFVETQFSEINLFRRATETKKRREKELGHFQITEQEQLFYIFRVYKFLVKY